MSDEDYESKLIENVKEHGWQATHVFDPDNNFPSFTYSIGFPETLGCGDFIIFGLRQDLMHNMLWEIFHQIKAGQTPADMLEWDEILGGGFKVISRTVCKKHYHDEYFNSSRWYLNKQMKTQKYFPAFQIVWPGAQQNKFPWDEGCVEDVVDMQPALWDENYIKPTDNS